ncbi:hypothetical protein OGAPHI_003390 [Ogataea philodendri]|uniref:CBM1 domain-containing protein n=1 Tax=Ogataea philodendri TaxID=1378263 RepID=A0A9P8P8G1_9ASCO|nr:uncharacterized protein OGAPHI_003390 [Ogataea philodendri]KAH3666940.1 hypothetical protein OGAPHI_003390 [Ogataea philodendri]
MLPTLHSHNVALATIPFFASVLASSGSLDDSSFGSSENSNASNESAEVTSVTTAGTETQADTQTTVQTATRETTQPSWEESATTTPSWEQSTTTTPAWEQSATLTTPSWEQSTLESITATSTTSAADSSATTCGAAYAQCGGLGYSGASCCQDGYQCVTANSYWARCVAASTLASSVLGSSAASKGTTYTTTYTTEYSSTVSASGSAYVTVSSSVVTAVVKDQSSVHSVSISSGGSPARIHRLIRPSTVQSVEEPHVLQFESVLHPVGNPVPFTVARRNQLPVARTARRPTKNGIHEEVHGEALGPDGDVRVRPGRLEHQKKRSWPTSTQRVEQTDGQGLIFGKQLVRGETARDQVCRVQSGHAFLRFLEHVLVKKLELQRMCYINQFWLHPARVHKTGDLVHHVCPVADVDGRDGPVVFFRADRKRFEQSAEHAAQSHQFCSCSRTNAHHVDCCPGRQQLADRALRKEPANTSLTFKPDLALASMNGNPSSSASNSPCFSLTCLLSLSSHLFPTKNSWASSLACWLTV